MATTGRPPVPTRLKVLRGTDRPSRRRGPEPSPRPSRPRVPADLSPAARKVWAHVIAEMGATGVITAADRDSLRVYCEAVARYVQAATMLEASGPLIVAVGSGARRGELVKNPLAQIVRDNALLVRAMARELGLTPASRAGLAAGRPADALDPFEAFLRGEAAR